MPKKNKAVLLVSSSHHDEKTDLDSKKPIIILDYYSLKAYNIIDDQNSSLYVTNNFKIGGVDTLIIA